jgi:Putative DNA-binding domain
MPATTPGWATRLADVLGAPPTEVTEEHLRTLVDNGVREDADLDFKETPYGKSDSERREFAGDIAAMANDRGGLIVIGIRDEDDVAAELTAVELVDGEEARLRQTAASNLAPHVPFEICAVPSSDDPGHGNYLLIVPPSSLRPHAVRQDRNLRYPRRDGTTTRWLSEAEVADLYRDRFRMVTDQSERVTTVLEDGLRAMDTREGAFLAVGLAPTTAGYMSIDRTRVRAVEEWAVGFSRRNYWRGFFYERPTVRVGAGRVMVAPVGTRPPNWVYLELHTDGSAFAGVRLVDPREGRRELIGTWVLNENLLWDIARCLRVVAFHARDHTGVWGDVLVEARLIGSEMELSYLGQFGLSAQPIEGGHTLDGPLTSRHTLALDGIVGTDQDLLASTRLVATDLFNAFGSAEVLQLTPDGTLRIRYIHGEDAEIRRLAEEGGGEVTEDTVLE